MKEVFSIDAIEQVSHGRWRVLGRAYEDVHVGDVLALASSTDCDPSERLTVTEIVTYGKQTVELSRMMTGTLILMGNDSGIIQQAEFLYQPCIGKARTGVN